MAERFLTLQEVMDKTTLSRTGVYRLMNAGKFPQSIALGTWKVVWREADVEQWMHDQMEAGNAGAEKRRERAHNAVATRWGGAA